MAAPMLLSLSSFGQFTSLSEQVLVIAVAGVLIAVLISLKRRPSFDLDKIPGPWTRAYPVVGNILECLRPDFHRKLLDWSNQYGGIYRIKFLWQDALIVTDPAALAGIMGRGDGAMDKAALVYAPINRMCTPHGDANLLTSAADDTWKAIRKSVAVSFSMQNIRKKFPLVLGRINQLIARLEALGPAAAIDVDQAALRVTLDIIGLAGFNHDYDCVSQDVPAYDHLIRVLPRCFTEVMLRIANPLREVFPGQHKNGPKGAAAFKMFQAEMGVLLRELKQRGSCDLDDQDLATQLCRVLQEHPHIPESRVLSEIGILSVEGFETTGHTTSWTLFNIASEPGVQAKIAEELDSLGLLAKPGCPPPRELQWEDLKRLPYLIAATKEAMRMLPVVSVMGRCALVCVHSSIGFCYQIAAIASTALGRVQPKQKDQEHCHLCFKTKTKLLKRQFAEGDKRRGLTPTDTPQNCLKHQTPGVIHQTLQQNTAHFISMLCVGQANAACWWCNFNTNTNTITTVQD
eukprot:GHRQ01007773.1.p1 GENE.GHRQ01007773.1~~GHRQ01007773.1.p1  ORF type:complete len:516 (+),score=176.63 GHRQ01007773.1:158-1705(+)